MGGEQEFRKYLCEAVDKIEDFEVDKKCINEDIRKIYLMSIVVRWVCK